MAEVLGIGNETDGGPWWHSEVRAALDHLRGLLGPLDESEEAAHKRGWNEALETMEDTTRDQLDEGQTVTREDVIRTARLLKDVTRPRETALPMAEHGRRVGVDPDGSLK
jgi:hypothetical protein